LHLSHSAAGTVEQIKDGQRQNERGQSEYQGGNFYLFLLWPGPQSNNYQPYYRQEENCRKIWKTQVKLPQPNT